MFNSWSGRLAAALLGACLCAPAALAQTKPATKPPQAATGPWAKVPALPTACYQDAFRDKLVAAQSAVQVDQARQEAVNAKIKAAYSNIEPMEMATRMQQWMMENPQEAMAQMQAAQTVGQELPGLLEADGARKQALDAERDALFKRYETALAAAYAPADAQQGDAANRLKRDQLYEAFCPQWWGAAGPIHAFVKKYRAWLVQEHIPYLEKFESQAAQTYAFMNTPAASFRSTATQASVIEYMQYIDGIFQRRIIAPNCPNGVCPIGL
jgi:hypothetical protein